MQMDLETLTKLLQNLHEELKTCMEHKIGDGPFEVADPIWLGDFIVDTYNSYLIGAKAACDHPMIQGLPEVEKLAYVAHEAEDTKRVGKDPRLHKMREVAFATQQLLTVLEGAIKTSEAKTQSEIVGLTTLLENLGQQLAHVQATTERLNREGGESPSVQPLVAEYNRYLGMVLETVDDPVLAKLFRPLELEGDDSHKKLSELKLAQSGLLSYLRKTHERSG
ncbi:hypothetical protein HYR99_42465 [Candidatus Poribacteria bacterium]|nr:hypothetical protein [Candidatus Poribacteria bacterium]